MMKFISVGAAMLALIAANATAQTTTSQSTTTVTTPTVVVPQMVAPPVGTLSTTRTEKTVGADGTMTDTTSSTYRNTAGVANDTVSKTTAYPPAVVTTDTRSSTTITKTP